MRKLIVIILALQLLLLPGIGYAQEPQVEVPQVEKSVNADLLVGKEPRKSLEKEANVLDPTSYPLIENGNFVDALLDSYQVYHYIYFKDITNADDANDMDITLLYDSGNVASKESILTIEFFKEVNNSLTYLGATRFNTIFFNSASLISSLSKNYYTNQPYIYMRVGISKTINDAYYSDATTFKVKNPFYSSEIPGETPTDDAYVVISNESTDESSTQPTGVFNLKDMKYTLDKNLNQGAYKLDVNKPFDAESNKEKLVNNSDAQFKSIGETRDFWVTNMTTNADYQINARLAYSGTKANIWVHDNQITDAEAVEMGKEFDQNIYPSVTNNFGLESDVNQDGKINILTFDIQDGFSGSGGYVGGYFWARDLYNVSHSNQSEIFYVDTYPSMGMSYTKDVSKAYETLAHEFQHMVNYNQNVLIEDSYVDMDTWLNEALSMAAEQIYSGQGLSDRIDYYNVSSSIQNGHSLLYWDDDGDVLSNYSLSYLFGQYIKVQANQGDRIFKEILADPNNDYKAVENVAKKYIDPNMTFGKLMTNFRIALLLKEPTGLYGFKGDPFFDSLGREYLRVVLQIYAAEVLS